MLAGWQTHNEREKFLWSTSASYFTLICPYTIDNDVEPSITMYFVVIFEIA